MFLATGQTFPITGFRCLYYDDISPFFLRSLTVLWGGGGGRPVNLYKLGYPIETEASPYMLATGPRGGGKRNKKSSLTRVS